MSNKSNEIIKSILKRKVDAERAEKKSKKQKVNWNWSTQSKGMMTPVTEMTFKDFLKEAKYYLQKEDWQDDVDEHGTSIGRCPKCKGEARIRTEGSSLATARAFWECQRCGHQKTVQKY